jgi:hypothetical protein
MAILLLSVLAAAFSPRGSHQSTADRLLALQQGLEVMAKEMFELEAKNVSGHGQAMVAAASDRGSHTMTKGEFAKTAMEKVGELSGLLLAHGLDDTADQLSDIQEKLVERFKKDDALAMDGRNVSSMGKKLGGHSCGDVECSKCNCEHGCSAGICLFKKGTQSGGDPCTKPLECKSFVCQKTGNEEEDCPEAEDGEQAPPCKCVGNVKNLWTSPDLKLPDAIKQCTAMPATNEHCVFALNCAWDAGDPACGTVWRKPNPDLRRKTDSIWGFKYHRGGYTLATRKNYVKDMAKCSQPIDRIVRKPSTTDKHGQLFITERNIYFCRMEGNTILSTGKTKMGPPAIQKPIKVNGEALPNIDTFKDFVALSGEVSHQVLKARNYAPPCDYIRIPINVIKSTKSKKYKTGWLWNDKGVNEMDPVEIKNHLFQYSLKITLDKEHVKDLIGDAQEKLHDTLEKFARTQGANLKYYESGTQMKLLIGCEMLNGILKDHKIESLKQPSPDLKIKDEDEWDKECKKNAKDAAKQIAASLVTDKIEDPTLPIRNAGQAVLNLAGQLAEGSAAVMEGLEAEGLENKKDKMGNIEGVELNGGFDRMSLDLDAPVTELVGNAPKYLSKSVGSQGDESEGMSEEAKKALLEGSLAMLQCGLGISVAAMSAGVAAANAVSSCVKILAVACEFGNAKIRGWTKFLPQPPQYISELEWSQEYVAEVKKLASTQATGRMVVFSDITTTTLKQILCVMSQMRSFAETVQATKREDDDLPPKAFSDEDEAAILAALREMRIKLSQTLIMESLRSTSGILTVLTPNDREGLRKVFDAIVAKEGTDHTKKKISKIMWEAAAGDDSTIPGLGKLSESIGEYFGGATREEIIGHWRDFHVIDENGDEVINWAEFLAAATRYQYRGPSVGVIDSGPELRLRTSTTPEITAVPATAAADTAGQCKDKKTGKANGQPCSYWGGKDCERGVVGLTDQTSCRKTCHKCPCKDSEEGKWASTCAEWAKTSEDWAVDQSCNSVTSKDVSNIEEIKIHCPVACKLCDAL